MIIIKNLTQYHNYYALLKLMIGINMEHLKQIQRNDIIGLTLYLAILEGCHFAPMWKTLAWQHLTKRSGLLLIHLAYLVQSQKSEQSCICLLRVSIYLFLRFWEIIVVLCEIFYYYHIAINIFIVNIVVISNNFSLNFMD
jgi:hypothetical protein